jgi:hypothetical protein
MVLVGSYSDIKNSFAINCSKPIIFLRANLNKFKTHSKSSLIAFELPVNNAFKNLMLWMVSKRANSGFRSPIFKVYENRRTTIRFVLRCDDAPSGCANHSPSEMVGDFSQSGRMSESSHTPSFWEIAIS